MWRKRDTGDVFWMTAAMLAVGYLAARWLERRADMQRAQQLRDHEKEIAEFGEEIERENTKRTFFSIVEGIFQKDDGEEQE
jgi:hypothetical protein